MPVFFFFLLRIVTTLHTHCLCKFLSDFIRFTVSNAYSFFITKLDFLSLNFSTWRVKRHNIKIPSPGGYAQQSV